MILADTSVWIDYYRTGDASFVAYLNVRRIWMHPFVLGEIACGTLKDRAEELRLMRQLPWVTTVSHAEVLRFIEQHRIMGRGIGYIDAHLLASTAVTDGISIWTRDRRLHAVAADLEIARIEP